MIIRVFDDEKADICDDLLTKLIQDERQYDSFIDENFVVNDYFKNVIKDNNNILLCYYEDNIVKGYIYLKPLSLDNANGYLIDGLYVLEEYRYNGIANKLIEYALDITKDSDFIDVNAMFDNIEAITLYSKFGFNEFKVTFRKKI